MTGHSLFKTLENHPSGTTIPMDKIIASIPWNADGLVPVIAQDQSTKNILMLAWANAQALQLTLSTKKAHYWSRSRQNLWCKGESSGHHQKILEVRLDCDGDALLYLVDQTGAACHTLRDHCFFWRLSEKNATLIDL